MSWRVYFVTLVCPLVATTAHAHDPLEITANAEFRPDALRMVVTMARQTAMEVIGKTPGVSFERARFEKLRPLFEEAAPKLFEITAGGRASVVESARVVLTEEEDVEFSFDYPRPASGKVRFDALHLRKLPPEGYGVSLTISGDAQAPMIGAKLLTITDPILVVALPDIAAPSSDKPADSGAKP